MKPSRSYKSPSGKQIKTRQMKIFEIERKLFLKIARDMARDIFRSKGVVSADDVRQLWEKHYPGIPWTNAAGAIFKPSDWTCVGYRPSRIPSRHGSVVRQWELLAA